jgi:hypothetical protein
MLTWFEELKRLVPANWTRGKPGSPRICGKPEEAEKWRAKLPQAKAAED